MKPSEVQTENSHRKIFSNPGLVIGASLVLFFTSQIIGSIIAGAITPFIKNDTYRLFTVIACNSLVLFCLIATAQNFLKFKPSAIGWNKPRAKTLWLVIPAFFVYFLASTAFMFLAVKFIPGFQSDEVQNVGFSAIQQPLELIAAFVCLSILTPIFEETIFRGVLFKGLRRSLPFWFSAIVTSLIFAIAHLQWNVAVDVFALSLVLCYLTERSNSIIPGILLHSLKNSLAFLYLFILK